MSLDVSGLVILILIMLVMFFLGMIMVPIGIFALTLPIVFPIIVNLGYDPIWFGIISLKLTEIGAITPPAGLNAYTVKGVTGKSVRFLTSCGVSLEEALITADVLTTADLRGIHSHGITQLHAYYGDRLKAGLIEPKCSYTVVQETSTTTVFDAGDGLGRTGAPLPEEVVAHLTAKGLEREVPFDPRPVHQG